MSLSFELLRHNAACAGVVLIALLLLTLLGCGLSSRFASRLLRSRLLDASMDTQAALSRLIWRTGLSLWTLLAVVALGSVVLLSHRQVDLLDWSHHYVERVTQRDFQGIGLSALKSLGLLLAAFFVVRVTVTLLASVRDRLLRTELLSTHHERLDLLLMHLRRTLVCLIVLGTVSLCGQLLELSGIWLQSFRVIAYITFGLYLARFAVGAAHLLLDVLFGLSDALSKLENPLRYLGRVRHLGPLTKRAADYFVYVAIATWVAERLTPGSWAAQNGHLGLRIIAIFYVSRVLVEVCLLLMTEFFLHRAGLSPSEQQQRQTLVPVAAGAVRYSVYFAAFIMMLREAGFDTTPLWAGAGAIGVAVGLGGQSLVGDLVAGFFILFENIFLVGDFVEVGEVKGKVEEIGVRVTKIRDEAGVLHTIPNGEVRKVASHSRGYVNVIIDLPIPHGEDLHHLIERLTDKMSELRAARSEILGETEFGIEDLRETSTVLRTVTMVKPGLDKEMSDVLRMALRDVLVSAGVSSPLSRHLVLTPGQLKADRPASPSFVEAPHRSDIQKIKAHNLYLALDVDDSGFIEPSDLDALVARVFDLLRRPHGSTQALDLRKSLDGLWNELRRFVDRNDDGRVSREEFLQFCASVAKPSGTASDRSITALANMLFAVYDRNGTGTLSEAEFLLFARAYGLSDVVAAAGFQLIDRDRNGSITKEEWLRFLNDVFVSQKLGDAAAVVFGPGCREHGSSDSP